MAILLALIRVRAAGAVICHRPRRLARPRTPPFHGDNMGSNPIGDTKLVFPSQTSCNIVKSPLLRAVPNPALVYVTHGYYSVIDPATRFVASDISAKPEVSWNRVE